MKTSRARNIFLFQPLKMSTKTTFKVEQSVGLIFDIPVGWGVGLNVCYVFDIVNIRPGRAYIYIQSGASVDYE